MKTKSTSSPANPATVSADSKRDETPFEAIAGICSVLVVGLFILTLLGENFVIPSGSMENTLLIGDHLLVDRITFGPPAKWMPLVHYREPKRGDVVVFYKPVPDTDPATGEPVYNHLVKRLIGVPGDHIRLRNGVVYVNGEPQTFPKTVLDTPSMSPSEQVFLDEFPSVPPAENPRATPEWAVESSLDIKDGDLVVPPGKFFMMGDHRHDSLDSRYWGFVPRENILGRPLFNYWSFRAPEGQYDKPGIVAKVAWLGHVVVHFFTDTRWSRTLKIIH